MSDVHRLLHPYHFVPQDGSRLGPRPIEDTQVGGDQQNGYFKSEIISTWFPLLQLHQGCSHWRHLPTCLDLRLGDSGADVHNGSQRPLPSWADTSIKGGLCSYASPQIWQRQSFCICRTFTGIPSIYRPSLPFAGQMALKWTIKDASPCRISWTPGAIQTVPLHSKNGCISTSVPNQNCGNLWPYVCHDMPWSLRCDWGWSGAGCPTEHGEWAQGPQQAFNPSFVCHHVPCQVLVVRASRCLDPRSFTRDAQKGSESSFKFDMQWSAEGLTSGFWCGYCTPSLTYTREDIRISKEIIYGTSQVPMRIHHTGFPVWQFNLCIISAKMLYL